MDEELQPECRSNCALASPRATDARSADVPCCLFVLVPATPFALQCIAALLDGFSKVACHLTAALALSQQAGGGPIAHQVLAGLTCETAVAQTCRLCLAEKQQPGCMPGRLEQRLQAGHREWAHLRPQFEAVRRVHGAVLVAC